jgi:hypothetical protein
LPIIKSATNGSLFFPAFSISEFGVKQSVDDPVQGVNL